MPSQPTEIRCPESGHLLARLPDGFEGSLSVFCTDCKIRLPLSQDESPDETRLECPCGRWLAVGVVRAGYVIVACRKCGVLVSLSPSGVTRLAEPRRERAARKVVDQPSRPVVHADRPRVQPVDIVALIEERWDLLRADRIHRSVDLAVGLRFDVFARDGFRCRYCGRGPDQSVYLEADHVVPRSAGGPDTLANLVTACWDCNHGKGAKPLTTG